METADPIVLWNGMYYLNGREPMSLSESAGYRRFDSHGEPYHH
jgi:hypothetical protein